MDLRKTIIQKVTGTLNVRVDQEITNIVQDITKIQFEYSKICLYSSICQTT